MNPDSLIVTLSLLTSFMFMIVIVFIIYLIHIHRNKVNSHKVEKATMLERFETTMLKSKLEITEQVFQKVASEIHDNIGQRLTLVSMHINDDQYAKAEMRTTTAQLVDQALGDLRDLSKNLSSGYILDKGIELALEREAKLISKSSSIKCTFHCEGEFNPLTPDQEIVLFRCAQEAINNSVKHAKATGIEIKMVQSKTGIELEVKDNGIGMDLSSVNSGFGLGSMEQRIKLLDGEFNLKSSPGEGTIIVFRINSKTQ